MDVLVAYERIRFLCDATRVVALAKGYQYRKTPPKDPTGWEPPNPAEGRHTWRKGASGKSAGSRAVPTDNGRHHAELEAHHQRAYDNASDPNSPEAQAHHHAVLAHYEARVGVGRPGYDRKRAAADAATEAADPDEHYRRRLAGGATKPSRTPPPKDADRAIQKRRSKKRAADAASLKRETAHMPEGTSLLERQMHVQSSQEADHQKAPAPMAPERPHNRVKPGHTQNVLSRQPTQRVFRDPKSGREHPIRVEVTEHLDAANDAREYRVTEWAGSNRVRQHVFTAPDYMADRLGSPQARAAKLLGSEWARGNDLPPDAALHVGWGLEDAHVKRHGLKWD